MKNKKNIIMFSVIVLIIIACLIIIMRPVYENAKKIRIAGEKYGYERCTRASSDYNKMNGDAEHPRAGGTAMTGWSCEICGRQGMSGTTNTPKLCPVCAEITGRCEMCGKLLK